MNLSRAILTIATGAMLITGCTLEEPRENLSGAGMSLDAWHYERSYPNNVLPTRTYIQESTKSLLEAEGRSPEFDFESLGPKNIAGRTLALGFDPNDPDLIYAGSASGGLWRTFSGGRGSNAWHRIESGFPISSFGAVAVHPDYPEMVFAGTGEVYNNDEPQPGVVNRLTRGTYGIGIIRSIDGGETWEKSLEWPKKDLTGIQEIYIDPLEGDIYAATTEGLYRSTNLGLTWDLIHSVPMAVDVEIHPDNPDIIYVSHGSYRNSQVGIYRSVDGGQSFLRLGGGFPNTYSGKTMIAIAPSNPMILYASIADYHSGQGLWKSENGGTNWDLVNPIDFQMWQGWYSHDVVVSPFDENFIIAVGIEAWVSTNGGRNLQKRSEWNQWYLGNVPSGGPEGTDTYVHADIHRVYFHPLETHMVYLVTDGGVFVSDDEFNTFEGRNGGMQTSQFYANFSSSFSNPNLAIGGMQDNATAIYQGDMDWYKVLAGDGMTTAIDENDVLYASFQNLSIRKSHDSGLSFESIVVGSAFSEQTAFSAPFELSHINKDVIFAGAERLHRSENAGLRWKPTSESNIFLDNVILKIASSYQTDSIIYVSTASLTKNPPAVFRSENMGKSWAKMDGLPDRIAKDIAVDPEDDNIAYITFSGFGSQHIYKTIDGGESWFASDSGLPDLPTNTIIIDRDHPDILYVGNDIGVYVSKNAGMTWEFISQDITDVIMVIDLSFSPSNRKLRVATHGNGVFETDMYEPINTSTDELAGQNSFDLGLYPNPAETSIALEYDRSLLIGADQFRLLVVNPQGQPVLKSVRHSNDINNRISERLDISGLSSGAYFLLLEIKKGGEVFRSQQSFLKV